MRILLVDDENLVVAGLRACVPALGDHEVASCANGQDALNRIVAWRPDLVFTDIKMPVMDGVELIRRARALPQPPAIVVLSCFDDFPYVKQSLQYGARDYILKHKLDAREIGRLIGEVQAERAGGRSLPEALASPGATGESVLRALRTGGLTDFAGDECALALLLVGQSGQPAAEGAVKSVVHDAASGGEIYAAGPGRYLLLLPPGAVGAMAEAARGLLRGDRDAPARLIAVTRARLSDLPAAYAALRRLEGAAFFAPACDALIDEAPLPSPPAPRESIDRVFEAHIADLNAAGVAEVPPLVDRLFQTVLTHTGYDRERFAFCVRAFLHQYAGRLGGLPYADPVFFAAYRARLDAVDRAAGEHVDALAAAAAALLKTVAHKRRAMLSPVVDGVLQYVARHLCERDLTMAKTARSFKLNPSYLSRLFKEQTGRNFGDCVMWARLMKARGMLRDTPENVATVARRCGFNNAQYFSSLFKRHFGLSPLEYRRSQGAQAPTWPEEGA
ncbi:MAG: response regulator [Clostridiales bacterium]|nr:response regulator [Clostridiales bacterium]